MREFFTAAFWRSVWWYMGHPDAPAGTSPYRPTGSATPGTPPIGPAVCSHPHADDSGICGLLEHVGIDTSGGIAVDGREVAAPYSSSGSDAFHARVTKALHDADHHSCQEQDGVDYVALADAVTRVRDKNMSVMREWVTELSAACAATATTTGVTGMTFGPCVKRERHKGWHEDADGSSWTERCRGCGHTEGEGCGCPPDDTVSVPRDALGSLVRVARNVSRGDSGWLASPPLDLTARRALGALDDAGLLEQFREDGDG